MITTHHHRGAEHAVSGTTPVVLGLRPADDNVSDVFIIIQPVLTG